MAMLKFSCTHCGPRIVAHKKGCPELVAEAQKPHAVLSNSTDWLCCPWCKGPSVVEGHMGGNGENGKISCKNECEVGPFLYYGRQYRAKNRAEATKIWNTWAI